MQDQTQSSLATLMPNEGDTATLTDRRDGNAYTVAKIGSLYWMTKNLNLPAWTTLRPSDSNVTANYTLPGSSTNGFTSVGESVYNSGRTTCSSPGCYSYYSWVAATAGTNPSSGEASSDICPKGWRLPTYAEFNTLKGAYITGAALAAPPFLVVYSGLYTRSSVFGIGSRGDYWSSTAYDNDANRAYYLYVISSTISPSQTTKSNGNTVRCVAK